jgi:hypothetical protein
VLWSVENNLNIANLDGDDFAKMVDEGGVFRGFLLISNANLIHRNSDRSSAESDVGPSYQSAGSRTDIHYARP